MHDSVIMFCRVATHYVYSCSRVLCKNVLHSCVRRRLLSEKIGMFFYDIIESVDSISRDDYITNSQNW